MLLADRIHASSFQDLDLIAIRGFQRREHCYVTGWSLCEVWEGSRQMMILFAKQYSKTSSVSCVPKPSHVSTQGF
jgi:hypothetical protein